MASASKPGADSDEESEEEEVVSSSYLANIGRVVYAEHTDKKSSKGSWFPALIVAPSASGQVKIDTKDEFLIRSFKDGRYYTVSKTDTNKFSKDNQRKYDTAGTSEAREKANTYIETSELPPHWDKDVLFNMGEESTTESSETESIDDDFEDDESPEEKDHLVAELYKHMEDRGQPINKTPSIAGRDVDLYRLFRIVFKRGGHTRVTNNNLWRTVALKLGFETTWCINQVRVHYKRYLQSFEELYRTLGCTMLNHPRSKQGSGSQSSRVQIRGKHRSGNSSAAASPMSAPIQGLSVNTSGEGEGDSSDAAKLSIGPDSVKQEDEIAKVEEKDKAEKKEDGTKKERKKEKEASQSSPATTTLIREKGSKWKESKEAAPAKDDDTRIKTAREEAKMTTRPRRDSTSSLAAAMQLKDQKDTIGEDRSKPVVRVDRDRETENEAQKLQAKSPRGSGLTTSSSTEEEGKRKERKSWVLGKEKKDARETKKEQQPRLEKGKVRGPPPSTTKKKPFGRKRVNEEDNGGSEDRVKPMTIKDAPAPEHAEEKQRVPPEVVVQVGDKIKVFYKCDTMYEAKVVKIVPVENSIYPKYYVHYQGWNARYDEYIKRSNIAENVTYNRDKERQAKSKAKYAEAKSLGLSSAESITTRSLSADDREDSKVGSKAGHSGRDRHPGRAARGRSCSSTGAHKGRASTPEQASAAGSHRTTSPVFKRQSSRNSMKKESEESEGDGSSSSDVASRKSQRIGNMKPTPSTDGRRSGRKRAAVEKREESEPEEPAEGESDTSKVEITPSKKRGRRAEKLVEESSSEDTTGLAQRSVRSTASRDRTVTRQTKSAGNERAQSVSRDSLTSPRAKVKSEDEEDPYAFKEPEPFDDSGGGKTEAATPGSGSAAPTAPKRGSPEAASSPSPRSVQPRDKEPTEGKSNEKRGAPAKSAGRSKKEYDSAESSSEDGNVKRTRSGRPMAAKPAALVKIEGDSTSRDSSDSKQSLLTPEEGDKATSPAREKDAAKGRNGQEAVPAQPLKKEPASEDAAQPDESQSKSDLSSDPIPAQAGKPVLQFNKKQQELFPFLSAIRTTTVAARSAASTPAKGKDESSRKADPPSASKSSPKSGPKSAKKRKMPQKPNSSELVESESESDGVNEAAHDEKNRAASVKSSEKLTAARKRTAPASESDANAEEGCSAPKARKAAASATAASSAKKEEQDDLDLACGETIPGSPVNQSLAAAPGTAVESSPPPSNPGLGPVSSAGKRAAASGSKSAVGTGAAASPSSSGPLETPFASVPESVPLSSGAKEKKASANPSGQPSSSLPPSSLPARKVFPAEVVDDLETPDASSASQSPREARNHDGGESSEVDMESITGQKLGSEGSVSTKLEAGDSDAHHAAVSHRGRGGLRRKLESSQSLRRTPSDASHAPSAVPKRRRKPREASLRGGRSGRGRHGPGRYGGRANDEETDDSEEQKDSFPGSLNQLDNEQLRELAQRPKNAKYNFFVDLDGIGDSNERILKIQESIENLKSTYLSMKSELAMLDRKSKKLKRKEREKGEREGQSNSSQLEVTA